MVICVGGRRCGSQLLGGSWWSWVILPVTNFFQQVRDQKSRNCRKVRLVWNNPKVELFSTGEQNVGLFLSIFSKPKEFDADFETDFEKGECQCRFSTNTKVGM